MRGFPVCPSKVLPLEVLRAKAEQMLSAAKKTEKGCLEFDGGTNDSGYGTVFLKKKSLLAHRIVWVAKQGPIPHGLLVLHDCDNPACINKDHLYLGTQVSNVGDSIRRGRWKYGGKKPKLSHEAVQQIRDCAASGWWRQQTIAEFLGVSQGLVNMVIKHQRWSLL